MKRKIQILCIIAFLSTCFSGFLSYSTAMASEVDNGTDEETGDTADPENENQTDSGSDTGTDTNTVTVPVNYIVITQYPSKAIYGQGDSLDFSDMVVQAYYTDGTNCAVTDYEILGYDSSKVGTQTVMIGYQNCYVTLNVTVLPAKVKNITVTNHNTTFHTLAWDSAASTTKYEIYVLDDVTGTFSLAATTYNNNYTFVYPSGTIKSYQICAIENVNGMDYKGVYSDVFKAAVDPEPVTSLTVAGTAPSKITLSWNAVMNATGYLVYRAKGSSANYALCGTVNTNSYTDEKLSSGTGYNYKVCAYTLDDTYKGGFSLPVETSTTPAKVILDAKVGDQKIRFTWSKVIGATSYDLYVGDENGEYTLLTSQRASSTCSYVAEGLITGNMYDFYAVANKDYKGVVYVGPQSDLLEFTMEEVEDTSIEAKYFTTEAKFLNSYSYKQIAFFRDNVDYTKSYVIPGLVNTNVGGFTSNSMRPQGITFAGDYLLLTAYDSTSEENSVIYVMDQATQELLTTLVLPSKTHAGGITFDGVNIWVPTGTRVSSIPFSQVEEAVLQGDKYAYVSYSSTCSLGITASFLTYYNKKLWVGSYNELEETNMYSYAIEDKYGEPVLTEAESIKLPTRVQSVSFTKKGTLILSRSCQLYKGLRGYMRQLDLYKPAFSEAVDGVIPLGECINTVDMPSMNEGIAISGSYIYVNFESASFDNASYKMDHICAFSLSSLTKKAA